IKQPGKTKLYLVGKPDQNMGGSTYYDVLDGSSNLVPSVDEENLVNVLQNITKVIANEQILSCHDISEGGLATAVAEMCFGGKSGASIRIPDSVDPEKFMFSENAGCFVVEVPVETNLRELMPNVPLTPIGFTNTDQEIIVDSGIERLFSEKTDELINAWQAPMKEIFQS
ncbi:phosphoribosylformylglycinamidine synthase, partial [Candidatus Saccharibacteria bacterium]|nr:phosphoribosylformylglycinamidine synthase [Candidatus Saccharibacteria bacterium]